MSDCSRNQAEEPPWMPELLAACQYLCAEIHNGCNRKDEAFMRGVAKAEVIIAKAEGGES